MSIDNHDDTIDSRSVIERVKELQDERDEIQTRIDEAQAKLDACDKDDQKAIHACREPLAEAWRELSDWDGDNGDELKALRELNDEGEGATSEWTDGVTLIRDSHFEDYAQELAEELGELKSTNWPMNCIDWERAARELKSDYTSIEFDGVTYWVRS